MQSYFYKKAYDILENEENGIVVSGGSTLKVAFDCQLDVLTNGTFGVLVRDNSNANFNFSSLLDIQSMKAESHSTIRNHLELCTNDTSSYCASPP